MIFFIYDVAGEFLQNKLNFQEEEYEDEEDT